MKHYFKLQQGSINSQFFKRVAILSVPTAVLSIILLYFDFLPLSVAVFGLLFAIICNFFLLFPISSELQLLRNYIYSLANGDMQYQNIVLSEKDTKDLADALKSIHRFWTSKTATLEAKALSDAAVFDTLPDPILMLDGEGNITGANLPAQQLLGENIFTLSIDKIFSTNIFIASVEKVLKGKTSSESVFSHAPEFANSQFYAHITRLPAHLNGRASAVISLYDISKAFSFEKMQSDFVANASHELRTPLSVISGFIETLQTSAKDDTEAREAFLAIMQEQAEYMSNLIEDLLSLSRLEVGQDKALKDKIDLHEVIDDIMQALKIKAFQHSINIKINELNRIPKIIGDNNQVHQVLQNLLDNAIKYAPENSEVTVEIKTVPEIPVKAGQNVAEGRAVSISFNNKGQKINKEDLARLTEKFYRMQVHKDMKIKGTGLGLAIAKQIVMHHRGNLTVSSTTYNGNTFTVYLPVKQKIKS